MMRRLKSFLVSGRAVATHLRDGWRTIIVESTCPESAIFYTAFFDNQRNCFQVIMEDDSFNPVAEAGVIPIGDASFVTQVSAG